MPDRDAVDEPTEDDVTAVCQSCGAHLTLRPPDAVRRPDGSLQDASELSAEAMREVMRDMFDQMDCPQCGLPEMEMIEP